MSCLSLGGKRINPSQPVNGGGAPPVKFFLYPPRLGWLVICSQYYHVEKAEAPNP